MKRYSHPLRVEYAQFYTGTPSFALPKRLRGRRAQGIRYERKVHEHFGELYGGSYLPSPWIIYRVRGDSKEYFAQPDGLLFGLGKSKIWIIECKFQHTPDAYYKLENAYGPLVKFLFPEWSVALVEVCKWYDRAVWFPSKVQLREAPHLARPGEIAVHIWKPD